MCVGCMCVGCMCVLRALYPCIECVDTSQASVSCEREKQKNNEKTRTHTNERLGGYLTHSLFI